MHISKRGALGDAPLLKEVNGPFDFVFKYLVNMLKITYPDFYIL